MDKDIAWSVLLGWEETQNNTSIGKRKHDNPISSNMKAQQIHYSRILKTAVCKSLT